FLKQVAPFFHDAPYLHYEHELTYLQLDQSLPLLITSFPIRDLPTSFSYTRNLTFMGKFTETNSAQSKFANNRMRTTTTFTTCIFTYFKFLFTFLFRDRKSTRLNSSHVSISYAVFCLKKKKYSKSF